MLFSDNRHWFLVRTNVVLLPATSVFEKIDVVDEVKHQFLKNRYCFLGFLLIC